MRRFLLFMIFFCGNAWNAIAQEEFVEPPSEYITSIPFRQLTGGVILLNAQFGDSTEQLNFILDTGSGGISLDSLTANYLNVKRVPSERTIRGIAGIRTVSFVYSEKLTFPGLVVDSLNFHINDYGILSAVYGIRIDGIIGYAFLSRYIIHLDYDKSVIEVWTRGSLRYPRGGFMLRPVISTLPVHSFIVRDAETFDARFLYDIGAGLCMLFSRDFVRDSSLFHRKRKFFSKEAEGLGGKVDMELTVIKEVRVGPYRFRKVPVYVFEDSFNVTSYPHLGGLIGNDLLRRFNVIMNYAKREFHLTPNTHFNDPFDYSYNGVELYQIGDEIVVGDLVPDSPAGRSGLKEGDVVVAVNKDFRNNLQLYKSALQQTGHMVTIIVRRGGDLLTFEFRVKSII